MSSAPTSSAPIAVALSEDGQRIARFGHDHPMMAIDAHGAGELREASGCCGSLAQAVADCRVVICTAIGQGAAGHLAQAGVHLALVPEGTTLAEALSQYRAGTLVYGGSPTACDHGHDHGHQHAHGGGCRH